MSRAEDAYEAIMKILMPLDALDREEAFDMVRHNGIFCVECGCGSPEHPNGNCQCWNEE